MAINQFTGTPDPQKSSDQARQTPILVLGTDGADAAHARDILTDAGFPHVLVLSEIAGLTKHMTVDQSDPLIVAAEAQFLEEPDFVATISNGRTNRDIAIIATTGQSDITACVGALQHGAADCVARPLVPAIFLNRVESQARLLAAEHEARALHSVIDRRTKRMNTALNLLRATERRLTDELSSVHGENRARIDYFAETNHELRTPLNAICGMSDAIRLETFGPVGIEKYKEYAHNIHQAGQHLLGIMDNRLSMSRIEAGAEAVNVEEVDVGSVIEETSKMLETVAGNAGVALDVNIEPDLPIIEADKGKLRQVMVNLLTNAIKYTPPKGRVLLTAKRNEEKGVLVLIVSDTGIGMTAEDLHSVMQPYHRIPRGDEEGSGLGLPIAKKLVEMMGGAIELRSLKGRGTSVQIELPMTSAGKASANQSAA
ncbi:MAG: ATP-binding protein [Alphaproteobacteria bacterium]|nr:ATP-binding protein [Alphaproteobacteria bacterium]